MIIKCFKVGGTAFSLGDGQSMPHMGRTVAAEVVKVGRKYVTVLLNGQEVRFYTPYKCGPYLMEDKNWGVPRLLFPTSEMAGRYRERGTEVVGSRGDRLLENRSLLPGTAPRGQTDLRAHTV